VNTHLPIETRGLAAAVRRHTLRMTSRANASHVGSGLSMADILAVLYGAILRIRPDEPRWPARDRLVVSKGHSAAAVYAVLAERGFFPREILDTYCKDDSPLAGHISHHVPGVEFSTGSLGHGLSLGCGIALAGRGANRHRAFVILSDGECDEGSIWEAALFAAHHGLDNLTAIVDYNKIQSFGRVEDVLGLEPFAAKWRAFGWQTIEIDGHDHDMLRQTLESLPAAAGRPTLLVAHTVKGKGVSFMEDRLAWHYKSASPEQLEVALREIEGNP
jgi:transketolase